MKGSSLINDLTPENRDNIVVIVAVVVVVGVMLIYTIEFILYSYASLRAHALECLSFNR